MPRVKKNQEEQGDKMTGSSAEKAIAIFEELDENYSAFKLKETKIKVIDTGSPALNNATGINGYPRGRITHIYGPEGAGKSFMAMLAVKNALEADPNAYAVWFDVESSFTIDWALKFGIWSDDPKKSRTKVIKGNKGKDIFERIVGKITKDGFGNLKKTKNGLIDYIKSGDLNCPIIVIDSIADMIAPREEAAPVGGLTVAALPGFLTAELKRISYLIEETDVALICINQVRQNIDEASQKRLGKYHYPGGENLGHKMSLNILCDKTYDKESVILTDPTGKDKNTLIGRKAQLIIRKNRFAPAPRHCNSTFIFTEGGSYNKIGIGTYIEELIDLAVKCNLIKKGGAWYSFNYGNHDEKFQGIEPVVEYFNKNPGEISVLYDLVKNTKISTIIQDNTEEDINDLLENNEEN